MTKPNLQDKRIAELDIELKSFIMYEKKQLKQFETSWPQLYKKIFCDTKLMAVDDSDKPDIDALSSKDQNVVRANMLNEYAKPEFVDQSSADAQSESKYTYKILNAVLESKLKKMTPELRAVKKYMTGYVKLLAANEVLAAISDDKTFANRQAGILNLLRDGTFVEMMKTNPDSNTKRALKILSLIAIIFGVGIITTAALAGKRLYDTNGRSANFFKPLSAGVLDRMTAVANVKEAAPAAV